MEAIRKTVKSNRQGRYDQELKFPQYNKRKINTKYKVTEKKN